jgi:hypothetical protein
MVVMARDQSAAHVHIQARTRYAARVVDAEMTQRAIAALREKYAEIRRLREVDAAGLAGDPRPAMRALARKFPGALRELDELTMAEIAEREDALAIAARDGVLPDWAHAQLALHAWLRVVLDVRRRVGKTRAVWEARRRLAPAVTGRSTPSPLPEDDVGVALDDALLAEILRPPRGRLVDVALARAAAQLGVSVEEIARASYLGRAGRHARFRGGRSR